MQKKIFVFAAVIASLALIVACTAPAADQSSKTPSPVTSEAPGASETTSTTGTAAITEPAAPSSALSGNTGYQDFLALQMGSPKEEVDAIMGEAKKMETSAFDGAGVEKYEYTKNGQTSWLNFRDGKLISKGTKEITDWSAPITKETFAKLANDMSFADAEALLGPGQLLNEDHTYAESLGEVNKTWFWNVSTGYQSVTIMFKNDKASYISDMNMD